MTTRRDFERSDSAKAFVRIYRGARQPAGRVDVTARVTDANGTEVVSKTDVVAAGAFTANRSADYSYELPLGTLRPGAYLLTIEVRLGSIAIAELSSEPKKLDRLRKALDKNRISAHTLNGFPLGRFQALEAFLK